MKNEFDYANYADFRALHGLDHRNLELYLLSCGNHKCAPNHTFGPGSREKFLIHFVLSGKGTFISNGKTYKLGKNQAFIIYPDKEITYIADGDDPWEYIWVGFNGTMVRSYLESAGITETTDVISFPENSDIPEMILRMLNANTFTYPNELLRQALLLAIMSELISYHEETTTFSNTHHYPYNIYTEQAIYYISKNYSTELSVTEIADKIGITRSYLAKCFTETLGISPKQYIIKYRMEKAGDLLTQTTMNVSETARAVGYEDPFSFSKAFKKFHGVSPMEWRSSNH